jgi:formamidopyrimidine-DNA glycosylase
MINLPEALTIAKQMNEELVDKRVEYGNCGNSPHKFAWYSRKDKEYEKILAGKTIGEAKGDGNWITIPMGPGFALMLGDMGGRILFHQNEDTLPKKYQFMLRFEDQTYLTVTIQMWGFIKLVEDSEAAKRPKALTPISDDFTYERFKQLIQDFDKKDKKSIKYFMISESGVSGIGNSYLQDIFFKAKIHPKRIVAEIDEGELSALYDSIREVIADAIEKGGSYDERDLFNNPGFYRRILDSKARGNPCQNCGTSIEKIQYLGGASYFCPVCQK